MSRHQSWSRNEPTGDATNLGNRRSTCMQGVAPGGSREEQAQDCNILKRDGRGMEFR